MRKLAGAVVVGMLATIPSFAIAQLQPPPDPRHEGETIGESDGRLKGGEDGSDLGRAQALVDAYVTGYRHALFAPVPPNADTRREDAASEDGRAEGHRLGLAAGLEVGRMRGTATADAAYAELRGRPAFRSEAPPSPEVPPAPPFDDCAPPQGVSLALPRGRSVDLAPNELESGRPQFSLGMPAPPYPNSSQLRARAREKGWSTGEDVDAWVDGYHDSFRTAFEIAFRDERNNLAWSTRRRWEDDGDAAGHAEASRRRTCEAFGRGHARGFGDGFDEGFDRGWREGWDASAQAHEGPYVIVERARLIDASDDGVLEPGEGATLELAVANAGLGDAATHAVAWSAVQSLSGEGSAALPLASQERRTERVDLGPVDVGAPLGATAIVDVVPLGARHQSITATVARPAVLESVTPFLDVQGDDLVLVARAVVRSTATRPVDRGLRITSGEAATTVAPLAPGTAADASLALQANGADLDRVVAGEVRLEGDDGFWMMRRFEARTGMERAVTLAAKLPVGSTLHRDALAAIGRRLDRELRAAQGDPKLYKRLGDDSELARFATTLHSLAAAAARPIQDGVARPILAQAEGRDVPRRVRSAVRQALAPGH